MITERTSVTLALYPISESEMHHSRYDRLVDPPRDDTRDRRYSAVDIDGIAAPGSALLNGDVIVNKQSPSNATEHTFGASEATMNYRPSPLTYKSPMHGYVDKVLLTSGETNSTLIKVLMRQTRRPELGDKFSSRHGQKGVCGLIVNQEDLPFNDQGISPGKPFEILCAWSPI